MNTRSSRRQAQEAVPEPTVASDAETASASGTEEGSMTPSPSEASSSSRTPSPIHSAETFYEEETTVSRRKGPRRETDVFTDAPTPHTNGHDSRNYADQILEYFISDTNQVPQLLVEPPPDFDPNMGIDDDGHTALHWACAMGRLRVVKLLLTHGADIFKVNHSGQTALMRSVMFSNNYDVRKFPELYELLHRSTLNIDNSNRTVFHHIVDVAMTKGKSHAARYYMETVLARLADYPKELADVINFQDEDGETALTMAARCRSKRLVKVLIDHGADPKIINGDGKSAEDYILEDERFRASPPTASRPEPTSSTTHAPIVHPTPGAGASHSIGPTHGDRPPVHISTAAQKASTRCVNDMTTMLDGLATSFDQELREKERDMNQAHALLSNIQAEILESQRTVAHLRTQAEGITHSQQTLLERESELLTKMGRRHRLGWERWVQDEEKREGKIRAAANGQLMLTPATTYRITDDDTLMAGSPSSPDKKGKRKTPATLFEDISDLIELYDNIPTDSATLQAECQALRVEVGEFNKKRKIAFQELVTSQAEAGTGGKMADYRRLIGAGCGGVPPSEVDHVLGMLLEVYIIHLL
jgi:transcription factor MBP1